MYNTRPHNSRLFQQWIKAFKAEQLPHPAYSPESAPSGFFLFGYIKGEVSHYNCESPQDFLKLIGEFFSPINKAMSIGVFES
jgi:hypothetical protein